MRARENYKEGYCCFCGEKYEYRGNNADPIHIGHGRCCDRCNSEIVLPARASEYDEIFEICSDFEKYERLELTIPITLNGQYVVKERNTNAYVSSKEEPWCNVFMNSTIEKFSCAGIDLIAIPSFEMSDKNRSFAFLIRGDYYAIHLFGDIIMMKYGFGLRANDDYPMHLLCVKDIDADEDLQEKWLAIISDVVECAKDVIKVKLVMDEVLGI